jgi:hypothetical protein
MDDLYGISDDAMSDLSTTMGTETLAANAMVPESFENRPHPPQEMRVEVINHRRFIRVDHTANQRYNSRISAIWDHGQVTLVPWAFDTLSVPAMSAKCERVFSSAKKLLSPERNKLADNTIEALECLKNWMDTGLATQQR